MQKVWDVVDPDPIPNAVVSVVAYWSSPKLYFVDGSKWQGISVDLIY